QRLVGPFGDHLAVGKAFDRGERGARIDDGDVLAENVANLRQRLADMHRAGDDELRRRHVDGEKDAAFGGVYHAALAGAQVVGEHGTQRILGDVGGFDQALLAARHIGDDDGGAAGFAFGVKRGEDVEFHGYSPRTEDGRQTTDEIGK